MIKKGEACDWIHVFVSLTKKQNTSMRMRPQRPCIPDRMQLGRFGAVVLLSLSIIAIFIKLLFQRGRHFLFRNICRNKHFSSKQEKKLFFPLLDNLKQQKRFFSSILASIEIANQLPQIKITQQKTLPTSKWLACGYLLAAVTLSSQFKVE